MSVSNRSNWCAVDTSVCPFVHMVTWPDCFLMMTTMATYAKECCPIKKIYAWIAMKLTIPLASSPSNKLIIRQSIETARGMRKKLQQIKFPHIKKECLCFLVVVNGSNGSCSNNNIINHHGQQPRRWWFNRSLCERTLDREGGTGVAP